MASFTLSQSLRKKTFPFLNHSKIYMPVIRYTHEPAHKVYILLCTP